MLHTQHHPSLVVYYPTHCIVILQYIRWVLVLFDLVYLEVFSPGVLCLLVIWVVLHDPCEDQYLEHFAQYCYQKIVCVAHVVDLPLYILNVAQVHSLPELTQGSSKIIHHLWYVQQAQVVRS